MKPDQFSSRNPPPSNREILLLAGIFIGLIAFVWWAIAFLANSLVWWVPVEVEELLGKAIAPAYEQISQPSAAQNSLNQLLDRLESNLPSATQQQREYRVFYVPQSTVNAIALPGDQIVVYGGLVTQAESENELMMILSHELGHFAHRDHLRTLGRNLLLQLAIAAFIGDTDALQNAIASSVVSVAGAQYSQAQERQADEFGLELLQSTYGHVAGATDFFARQTDRNSADFAFFSTHPTPGNRVTQLQRVIREKNYRLGMRSPLPDPLLNLQLQTFK